MGEGEKSQIVATDGRAAAPWDPAYQEGPSCKGPDRAHTQPGPVGAPEPHPEQRARAL